MTQTCQIGKEARELDQKRVIERMKLEKKSLIKIGFALIFYALMMGIFIIFM
ncbi:MAG: hypothetical protein P8Y70_16975 [Candidatus Lokiarchaeota archaeon]